MNMYITNLTGLDIDWASGPVIFSGNMYRYFTTDKGKLWDAQIIPIIKAHQDGIEVSSIKVGFMYPQSQRIEEEGNEKFIEKRLYQINYMVEAVKKLNT